MNRRLRATYHSTPFRSGVIGGRGAWLVNNGYDGALASQAVASGRADAVAFGKAFIANPDLVDRLRKHAALNEGDTSTYYGGGEKGYTDYPTLAD